MNTTENNKKIAEFMGADYNEQIAIICNDLYNSGCRSYEIINNLEPLIPYLHYHSCWNWLMEVVERIEGLETNKQFLDRESFNHYQKVLSLPIYTPIEVVYKAVVTFIDWYNENSAKEK